MKRHFYKKLTFLALFLMLFQIFSPLGNALATASMLPPSNLAAQQLTPDDVKLTWSSVFGATGYNVYEITEGQLILRDKVTTPSFTLNNLAEGSYRYVVSTLSSEGESGPSAPVSVNIVYPEMKAPTTLTNTIANGNDITLNWNAAENAEKYNVYQISTDGEKTLLTSQTARSYKILDTPEGTFTYAVSAWHSLYGESPLSNPVDVEIVYPTMNVPNTFTYSIANGNDVTLKWDAVSYAESFNLYKITNDEKVLKTTVTGTSFKLSNAPAGKYKYEVRSNHSQFGESAEGKVLEVIVAEITMTAPNNFTYELQNVNDIYLKWDTVPYADNYNIYEVIDGEKVLKSKNFTGTNTRYLKAEAGDHTYVIHSFSNKFGESAEGSQVSLSIDQVVLEAPENFKYNILNGNDIELSWDSTSNTTNYKVYQINDDQKVLKVTLSGTTTSYTFTRMPAGEYKYEIHSFSTRFGESEKGSQVAVSLVHPVLNPPLNVKETILNDTDFTLSWDSTEYAESYRIYKVVDGQKTYLGANTGTSKTYSSMPSGAYTFIVHSYSSRFGLSEEGTELSFTLKGKTMAAPTNLDHIISNGNDIKLTWKAVENATGYNVYQVIDEEKILKKTLSGTTVSFTNAPAGEYHYLIHSYSNLFGESVDGAEIKVQLVHPVLESPGTFSHSVRNGNDLVLTWTAAEYANSYKIYEVVGNEKVLKYEGTALTRTLSKVSAGKHTYIVYALSSRFGESPAGTELNVTMQEYTMDPPEISTKSVTNINTLKIGWKAVEYANRYKVYEIVNGEKVLKSTVTSLSTTLTNLSDGEHKYEIYSESDRFGVSPEGSKVSAEIVYPIIQAPGNIAYEIQKGNDIVLNWTSAEFASNYKIYEMIDGQKILKGTATGLTITLVDVSEGSHSYVIHTFSSRFGESVDGKKLEVTVKYPTMKAPTEFSESFANGNDLTLEWNKSEYVTNYRVYQIINGTRVLKSTVSSTKTTLVNIPEGDYKFEVYPFSSRFGESPEGRSLSFKMVYPTMQAPENLTQTISNGNDITLRWNPATYATGYIVYQIINGEKVFQKSVSVTSISFTNLPEGDYHFVVHSYSDRFGESPVGTEHSFEMVHPIMQKPENFYQTIMNGNDIRLRWNASEYATSYRVYQINDGKKELIKTLSTLLTTYTNMAEGDYEYVVHSYSDRFGESPEGSPLNFNLTWPEVQSPNITGSIFNVNNITFSWPAANWANEYRVYQITDGERKLVFKGTARTYTFYNLTEKTHSFEVTAFNTRFGESKPSNLVTETIVYPEMEVPKVSLKVLSETSARISWDFVTYANGYNIYELIDGKPVLVAEKVNNLSYTLNNLSYANHLYYVTSYSNSFGESDPSETVLAKLIVDEEAPVTTSDAPTEWTNKATTIQLSATDNETGVAATYYSLDGTNFIEGTTFTVNQEGIQKVSFYSVDKVGNKENVKTAEVKIDKTKPETASDIGDGWATSDVKVNLTSTDELSGVAKTFYSVNGSEFAEGTTFTVSGDGIHQVAYYSVDNAGNKEEFIAETVKIDSHATVTTSNIEDSWASGGFTVTFESADQLSGVDKTYYSIDGSEFTEGASVNLPKDGIYEVSYYSTDVAGNQETIKTEAVKVDNQAPVTTSNIEEKWYQDTVEIILTTTDNLSGVAATYFSINDSAFTKGDSLTIEEKGSYKISYYSVDKAGNKEEVKTETVDMDSEAPMTVSNIEDKWYLDGLKVTLTPTDDFSGVAKTFYSVNGSDFDEGTKVVLAEDGVYEVSYYSIDKAGNIEEVKKEKVKVDGEAPETTDNNSDSWFKTDADIKLSANDNLSKVQKTFYSINDSEFVEGSSFTVTDEGINLVKYYSVDKAGNMEEVKSTEVKIDKTDPIITANVDEEYMHGSKFAISYNVYDEHSGVAVEEVLLNGVEYQKGDTVTLDQPGVYTLTIKVTDHAGWTTTVEKKFVVYIPASLEVLPKVIKGNKGIFTVKANLPAEFARSSFSVSTATLNGVAPKVDNNGLYKQAEKGHFKFEREDFDWKPGKVGLEFRAYLDNGYLVVGSTLVDVK